MLCPSCHTENRDNARFCKKCGLPLSDEQSVQAQPEQTAAPVSSTASTPQTQPSSSPVSTETVESQKAPVQDNNGNNAIEDISQAPTQFLTPQRMMEYHRQRWEHDQQSSQAYTPVPPQDIADQPTIHYPPEQAHPDVADLPTIAVPPISAENEPSPAAASAPEDAVRATDQTAPGPTPSPDVASADTIPQAEAHEPDELGQSTEQTAPQPETQKEVAMEQAASTPTGTADFPVLEVGTRVSGRYEITQVISAEEHEHTYQVTDHQGYQRCWNCGSTENSEGDDFCIDCGANLHDAQYIMHEYPASAATENEASVLAGVIVNTFMEQNRTYVIEQPQASQIAFPNGVHLLAASDSDAGDTRRGEPNEDSTLVLQFQRIHESQATPVGIFVVADGMGGHDNGQVASRMTISQIAERFIQEMLLPSLKGESSKESGLPGDEEQITALLHSAIEDANTALCQVNQRDKTDMGSTLTGFMIVGDLAYIFNVGDSRTYMLRDGNLYQLTTDHSLVSQLVAGGLIEPDEVYTHPQRNQIFRSIGDKLNVQIDIFKQQIHPGDVLLSCCDGLWEMVRNPQITEILSNAPDPQNACTQLIEAANTNGGEDNISAVVVYVR
jgi:serine/threonine protein phosphatase PrpC